MAVLLPILTLLLGQLLGYWFAISQTKRRIAAEKRSEYVSRFIGEGYANLRYLGSRQAAKEGVPVMAPFSILGQQAGFFVSDEAAKAMDRLTSAFASSLVYLGEPDSQSPRDVWKEYREELEAVRKLLRKEVQAGK